MADVYVGRFNRYFEKLFNIKGGPAVVDVESAIRGSISMNQPVMEERYLVGTESFAVASAQVAVAGNKSAAMIRNPLGSNVIATIEKISVFSPTAEQINIAVAGSNPADLASVAANHNRADPRGRSVGTCITTNDAPAADPQTGFLNIAAVNLVTAGASFDIIQSPNQEIVLLPQIALRIIGNTINQLLLFTIFWRERPLETSELT